MAFPKGRGDLCVAVASARPDDLIMCHPAISNSAEDALGEQRVVEYRVLAGTQLPSILHALNAQIVLGVPTMKR